MKKTLVAALIALPLAGAAFAEGDAAKGEKVFNKCKACHMVGDNAQNRVGPELNGVVGRPIGAIEDFKYSAVFQDMAAEGRVWTEEELTLYLANPKAYAKGTKMAFAGLKKDDEISNVIAYLATFQ